MLATAFPSTEYPFDLLHSEMVDLIFSNVDMNDKVWRIVGRMRTMFRKRNSTTEQLLGGGGVS